MAIKGLVSSVLSILLPFIFPRLIPWSAWGTWVPWVSALLGIGLAVVGIMFSAKALNSEQKGIAIAGLVVGIIGGVLGLFYHLVCAVVCGSVAGAAGSALNSLGF
jgi:hypothetical protein